MFLELVIIKSKAIYKTTSFILPKRGYRSGFLNILKILF